MSLADSLASLADSDPHSVWLASRRDISDQATPPTHTDLLIVGAGLTGLWAAYEAAQTGHAVTLVDAQKVGSGASGRCGGFINASITHGIAHGHHRWPDEMATIVAVQESIWRDTLETLRGWGAGDVIEPYGKLTVATRPHQVTDLASTARLFRSYGQQVDEFDAGAVRARLASPTYLGGLLHTTANGLCDPVRLTDSIAAAARAAGVVVVEDFTVATLDEQPDGVRAVSKHGRQIVARRAFLATNASRPLVGSVRRRMIPIYDHVIATAPLSEQQWAEIGGRPPFGITDAGNQFHYYRATPDGRILFGGWDATYHFGGAVHERYEHQRDTHETLVRHLVETFPTLAGIEVTHAWGGPIDSTTRFTPMFGTAMSGRLAWAIGFTGLGVGSSRFAAQVGLDLLEGRSTERTSLSLVRRSPLPFPPEPVRSVVVALTKRSLQREDITGRRNPWLRFLDRIGVGFDT